MTNEYTAEAIACAEAIHDHTMIIGPTRLERSRRKNGSSAWTPYVRAGNGNPTVMIQYASEVRTEAIQAQVNICAEVDEDFRHAITDWVRAEDKSKGGELPLEYKGKAAQAPAFVHLHATTDEAEQFICDLSHLYGYDSDGRFTDLDLLLRGIKATKRDLEQLTTYAEARKIQEAKAKAEAAEWKARAEKYESILESVAETLGCGHRDFIDCDAIPGATKMAVDRMERAEQALRDYASQEAAHDNYAEWAHLTTLAQIDCLLTLISREGDKRIRDLVSAFLADQPDDYTENLRGLAMTAAAERNADDVARMSERGRRRLHDALTAWLAEVMPLVGGAK